MVLAVALAPVVLAHAYGGALPAFAEILPVKKALNEELLAWRAGEFALRTRTTGGNAIRRRHSWGNLDRWIALSVAPTVELRRTVQQNEAEEIQLFEARMPFFVNFFAMSRRRLVMLGTGLASLFQVVSIALAGVFGSRGTAKERITAALTTPRSQRLVFDVMRAPFSTVLWSPLRTYLADRGVELRMESEARSIRRDGQ